MATDYSPQTAEDVTDELVEMALGVVEGWYAETRIDWEAVLDRMERYSLSDGRGIDWGTDLASPAVRRLKDRVRAARR